MINIQGLINGKCGKIYCLSGFFNFMNVGERFIIDIRGSVLELVNDDYSNEENEIILNA